MDHIDIDPCATLAVMCDHCITHPSNPPTEEDLERETLKRLVLLFFVGEGKETLKRQLKGPQNEVEVVFRDGLVKAYFLFYPPQ
jgi:hypothetical protein